jgi:hypothetical protein
MAAIIIYTSGGRGQTDRKERSKERKKERISSESKIPQRK